MKCQAAQRRLLEAEDPALPPEKVRHHLAACPACRQWQRRLVQVERHVPLLPVPAGSGPPADLLQRLERAASQPAPRPVLRFRPLSLHRPPGASPRGPRPPCSG